MLDIPAIQGGFQGGISVLFSSCFLTFVLLLALFLAGLSTYGAPVTALVPIFFGLGAGLTEAYYYGAGRPGILFVALLVVPRVLIAATALLMGCSESLRMSLLLSGQLLPNAALRRLMAGFPALLRPIPGLFWSGFCRGRSGCLPAAGMLFLVYLKRCR